MADIGEFETDDRVKIMMDKFEDLMIEVDKIELTTNLRYTLYLQFVNRLIKCGKFWIKIDTYRCAERC